MKPLHRYGTLAALTALLAALPPACQGTETDNPIAGQSPPPGGYVTPDRSQPAQPPPPACAPSFNPVLEARRRSQRTPLFRSDGSPVALPFEGELHQSLLLTDSRGVAAVHREPVLSQASLPAGGELGRRDYLLVVDATEATTDASDPAPILSRAEVQGEYWQLLWKDDVLWVLSAILEQQGCETRTNLCDDVYYEGLRLVGYQLQSDALVEVHDSEYPFGHAQLSPEGFAVWHEQGISVRSFGAPLSAPATMLRVPALTPEEGRAGPGPMQITTDRVRAVWLSREEGSQLLEYDLSERGSDPLQPAATLSLPAMPPAASTSVFHAGYLWLDSVYSDAAPRLFRLAADGAQAPEEVPLPENLVQLLPLVDPNAADPDAAGPDTAGSDTAAPALRALAYSRSASGSLQGHLVSISGLEYAVLESWNAERTDESPPSFLERNLQISFGREGAGLPLQVDFLPPPDASRRPAIAFAAVEVDGVRSELTLNRNALASDGSVLPPELVVERADTATRIEAAPSTRRLLSAEADALALLVATSPVDQCSQSGLDCTGYAPGVQLVSLRGEPRLTATLPFPDLPLPSATEPHRVTVDWQPEAEQPVPRLSDGRYVFWANAYLNCRTSEVCDAWGVAHVPIAEANVIDLSPSADFSVWGEAHRQYFFALDPGSAGGRNGEPGFVPLGVSQLEGPLLSESSDPRFADPRVSGQMVLATRLQRRDANGNPIPEGSSRVMVDAFLVEGDNVTTLPPLNAPGRPLAHLSSEPPGSGYGWLTLEPLPGEDGNNDLHVCGTLPFDEEPSGTAEREQQVDDSSTTSHEGLTASAMTIVQSESLPPSLAQSRFIIPTRPDLEAEVIATGNGNHDLAFVVTEPQDACGESLLHSFLVEGSAASPRSLTLADSVSLPSNRWQLVTVQPGSVLLAREAAYALFEWSSEGQLSLVSVQSSPQPLFQLQLRGTELRGAAGRRPFLLSF